MPEPPPASPESPSNRPDENQPLLAGLDARRLVAGLLEDTGPLSLPVDWEAPTPVALGHMLVGYEVKHTLGRGGMGAVYLAREARLGRDVAIKVLPPELGQRHDFRQRFEREAWILAQLDHPHIVRLYKLGESEDGNLYLVMEYVEGTNLADLLRDARAGHQPGKPVVPWARLVQIIGQLCQALAHAHAQGLIHRDLKPANVLLTRDGSVKLADFGLARPMAGPTGGAEARALMTQTGQVMGTYDYMAPEQRDGLPGDHRVDLYGVGVLLYQLLTGSLPRGAFTPPSALVGTAPAVDRLVLRALATDPGVRTPSAESLRTELLACPPDGRPSVLAHPALRVAAAALGLVALSTAIWAVSRPAEESAHGPADSTHEQSRLDPAPARDPAATAREERRSFLGQTLWVLPETPTVWVAEALTTVAHYRKFVTETKRRSSPAQWAHRVGDPLSEVLSWEAPGRPVRDDEPVVCVSWQDAHDFCHWMTRQARGTGELEHGQEYRLPTVADRRGAHAAGITSSVGSRLEEWCNEHFAANRPWHSVRVPATSNRPGSPPGSSVSAVHDGGHPERGFRIALDLKTPEQRPESARLWAAADAWGGGADGRPPVTILVTPEVVKIDLTRRPEIDSLEPLRGLGLTEFRAAPAAPLDLGPLAGQPLERVFLAGAVGSLEPLARSPLTHLSIGEFGLLPPTTRRPPPSLAPFRAHRRLSRLTWRCQSGPPDVPIRDLPGLTEFVAWDCDLDSLEFIGGSSLPKLTIDRTRMNLLAAKRHLGRVRDFEKSEQLISDPDRRALAGDLEGAVGLVGAMRAELADFPWFDWPWQGILDRRRQLWTEWQSLGLGPWMRAGAAGPPPGSVEWRGRWFYLLPSALNRTEAEYCAASWGACLATLGDPEEEAFVRASVLTAVPPARPSSAQPVTRGVTHAHLGAWRAAAASPWRWVTGEPWTSGPTLENRTKPPGSFLVLQAGADRWTAEHHRQEFLPVLLEWGSAEEIDPLRALERRLLGTWGQADGRVFELRARGLVGPAENPGDRWFVVEAAAGQALVSWYFGKHQVLLTTTADPARLVVTRPDGSSVEAMRHSQ